ncbi:MAG: chloride channel protein [Flavobacteriales bacterium]|nr:chloride channel protein [Flavobacteriales bacterium]
MPHGLIHNVKTLFHYALRLAWSGEALRRFTIWRYRHMSMRQFILLSSILIGLVAGVSSVLLKNFTHWIQYFVEDTLVGKLEFLGFYFAFPIIGISLTLLVVHYVLRGKVGHGIPNVLYALSRKKSILPFKSTYSALITAPLTVGFGGSAGLEGPAVATGAALGSNFSKMLHMDSKSRQLLLACGTAAALSAIFKVPITGLIFVIEVFSLDLTMASLIPLMLSSATGVMVSYFFMGQTLTLDFESTTAFQLKNIMYYVGLALFAAIASIHFTKIYSSVGHFFEKRLKNTYVKLVAGALSLGCLLYFMPTLYGEGYDTINALLAQNVSGVLNFEWVGDFTDSPWVTVALLVVMLYLKMFATTITFGAGGVGGTFAPTLFMGAVAGSAFSQMVNIIYPSAELCSSNFALVGMTGIMAGVMQAPLTAVFLIVETTGGYALIAPLMVVSAISFIITRFYIKYSVYTEELVKKGDVPTHDKDKTILDNIDVDRLIERDFIKIPAEATLGDVVHDAIAISNRNIFPVVSKHNHLIGIVLLDDIRHMIFDSGMYNRINVSAMMQQPPAVVVHGEDTMATIMQKFQETGAWNLPVVGYHYRYVGFISKSKLLSIYRRKMLDSTSSELF